MRSAKELWRDKKSRRRIIAVCLLLTAAILVSVAVPVFLASPEYALISLALDVKRDGAEGVREHMTDKARMLFDTAVAVSEQEYVAALIDLFNKDDYVGVMKAHLPDLEWGLCEIRKDVGKTHVLLSFVYKDDYEGKADIILVKEDGEWKIGEFAIPEFREI